MAGLPPGLLWTSLTHSGSSEVRSADKILSGARQHSAVQRDISREGWQWLGHRRISVLLEPAKNWGPLAGTGNFIAGQKVPLTAEFSTDFGKLSQILLKT